MALENENFETKSVLHHNKRWPHDCAPDATLAAAYALQHDLVRAALAIKIDCSPKRLFAVAARVCVFLDLLLLSLKCRQQAAQDPSKATPSTWNQLWTYFQLQ